MVTKVLVVDDEHNIVQLIREYLEREGFEVRTASDGPSALDWAREWSPDLVVLDVMLPGLDGIEVCRALRQFSDAYVLMLTARAEEVDRIRLTVGLTTTPPPFSPGSRGESPAMLRRPRTAQPRCSSGRCPSPAVDLAIDRAATVTGT
jgi:CheY-like chemotaxis protein